MFKATVNTVTPVSVNIKKKWYKKAEPVEMQQKNQLTINGLTKEESEQVQLPFSMKLIGLFTNSIVESIKIEEEADGNN